MGALNFDARTVTPAIGVDPVPDVCYIVIVLKSNIKATNAGVGGLLELILQIIEGQYNGRTIYWNLNLFNKSAQAVEIAYKQLSALCHVVGQFHVQDQNVPDQNVPQLHNIPFNAHAVIAQGNKGAINNIVAVKDINGNDPGKGGQGAPMVQPAQGQPFQQSAQPGFTAPAGFTPQPTQQQPTAGWQPQQPAQTQPQNPAWSPSGQPQQQPQQIPPQTATPTAGWTPPQQPAQPQQQPQPQQGTWQAPAGGTAPNAPWSRPA
jgi:hypothetical protein